MKILISINSSLSDDRILQFVKMILMEITSWTSVITVQITAKSMLQISGDFQKNFGRVAVAGIIKIYICVMIYMYMKMMKEYRFMIQNIPDSST